MRVLITRVLLVFLLSSSLLVSGCGFHLRGQIEVPQSLERMHVKGADVELVNDIERSLKFSSIDLVAEGDNAALLDVSNTSYVSDVIGTSSGGIATSYKLTYRVNYVVYAADGEVLQADNVMQNRTLAYDPSQVLLFEREEIFLKEDMRKNLVSFILRRMSKIQ
jgi:LPS-assembly lipoprotein